MVVMKESLSQIQRLENSKLQKKWITFSSLVMVSLTSVLQLKCYNVFGRECLKTKQVMFMNNVDELLIRFLKHLLQRKQWTTSLLFLLHLSPLTPEDLEDKSLKNHLLGQVLTWILSLKIKSRFLKEVLYIPYSLNLLNRLNM